MKTFYDYSKIIEEIQSVLNNKKILSTKVLSNSFDINCVEFLTSGNEKYIVKYYNDYNKSFNAIKLRPKTSIP